MESDPTGSDETLIIATPLPFTVPDPMELPPSSS
jgi:hypothetical protein